MHRNDRREAREAKRGVFSRAERTALIKVVSGDEAANEYLGGVTDCVKCTVCGGDCAPEDNALCASCRGLAATFARSATEEELWIDARERGIRAGSAA